MTAFRFLAGFLLTLTFGYSLWTQTGPFAWVASIQLAIFGSYVIKITLILSLAIFFGLLALVAKLGQRKGSEPGGLPTGAANSFQDRATLAGIATASAAVLAAALSPFYLTPAEPKGDKFQEILANAPWTPTPVKVPIILVEDQFDFDAAVTISGGRSSSTDTQYVPLHEPGKKEVLAIASGTENDWRNSGVSPTPDALLAYEPVPLITRRFLAEKQLEVPTFRPTLHWGRSVANIVIGPIIAASVVLIISVIAFFKVPRASSIPAV